MPKSPVPQSTSWSRVSSLRCKACRGFVCQVIRLGALVKCIHRSPKIRRDSRSMSGHDPVLPGHLRAPRSVFKTTNFNRDTLGKVLLSSITPWPPAPLPLIPPSATLSYSRGERWAGLQSVELRAINRRFNEKKSWDLRHSRGHASPPKAVGRHTCAGTRSLLVVDPPDEELGSRSRLLPSLPRALRPCRAAYV